jgi:nicotinate phosphoribosyltransferase
VISVESDRQEGEPLLRLVMQGGRRTAPSPPLADIRTRSTRELARLPGPLRALEPGVAYPVAIGDALRHLAQDVDLRIQETA